MPDHLPAPAAPARRQALAVAAGLGAVLTGAGTTQARAASPAHAPLDVARIFADIDSRDPDRFVSHLTEDVAFRFGNAPMTVGRPAVRSAVAAFYGTIAGMRHDLLDVWRVPGTDVTVVRAEVTYLRKDGRSVTVPNTDILRAHGRHVREWLIYIDVAPVFAP